MKARTIIAALLPTASGVQTAWTQSVTIKLKNNKTHVYSLTQVDNICFDDMLAAGHRYVDLGLPSGTLWATCNVGADCPEDCGNLFAWGETAPKDEYSWNTYKWCEPDENGCLASENDAATVLWGSDWHMPDSAQFAELLFMGYTTVEDATVNGIAGKKITSNEYGNSIFLPVGGSYSDTSLNMSAVYGAFWTRDSYHEAKAFEACFWRNGSFTVGPFDRCTGHNVRPVKARGSIGGHEYVEIGGLKWATMNLGATTEAGSYETCYGDYFAWGETQPRYTAITRSSESEAAFTWRDGYSNGYDSYPDYIGTTLDAAHDAAAANWGDTWRVPTSEEFCALAMACSGSSTNIQGVVTPTSPITAGGIYWLSSTQNIVPAYTGVAGILFVSQEDISKRVFFPASGRVLNTTLYYGGMDGHNWSSTLYRTATSEAYYMFSSSRTVHMSSSFGRGAGFAVRPVSE